MGELFTNEKETKRAIKAAVDQFKIFLKYKKWKGKKEMIKNQDLNDKVEVECLQRTIKWFKKQIEPHDCGWMYTTIDGLKHRIKILKNEMKKDLPKETWVKGYNKHKKSYNKWKEKHE